jgi:hypothetical protein
VCRSRKSRAKSIGAGWRWRVARRRRWGRRSRSGGRCSRGPTAPAIRRATDAGLADVARAVGLDGAAFRAALNERAQAVYDENLEAALAAGCFGVPSFVTPDGEVFWGQDRLPILADHLRR